MSRHPAVDNATPLEAAEALTRGLVFLVFLPRLEPATK